MDMIKELLRSAETQEDIYYKDFEFCNHLHTINHCHRAIVSGNLCKLTGSCGKVWYHFIYTNSDKFMYA